MRMTYESMMLFAETWIAAWNRRDIDAVLVHFADEAQFVSPGRAQVRRAFGASKQERD
jgi:ketosteroid isomerase-like protein